MIERFKRIFLGERELPATAGFEIGMEVPLSPHHVRQGDLDLPEACPSLDGLVAFLGSPGALVLTQHELPADNPLARRSGMACCHSCDFSEWVYRTGSGQVAHPAHGSDAEAELWWHRTIQRETRKP